MSLNQCQFLGNLGADPEVRSFGNGGRVCNLRLAVTEKWKDRNTGERKERTEWVPVAIFNDGLVGVAERYLRKGSKVFIQGQFRTRKWQDQSGSDRYTTEIVLQGPEALLQMLDGPQGQERREGSQRASGGGAGGFQDDLNDDIPFITRNSVW
jgi:single-strand DNA-binding protein